jgi:multisubunit Na+/H+ antiporter MnhF subunit
MNEWEIVAAVLTACLVGCTAVAAFASVADALIALEIAGSLASAVLMVLSEGLQRQPFIDLALTLSVLSLLGALAFARMLEGPL